MILRSLNVEEATHADVLSGDELRGLVATSREHGEIEHDKAAMLHKLFEFDQRYVGRVMIPRNDADVLDIAATGDDNRQRIRTVNAGSPLDAIKVVSDQRADVAVYDAPILRYMLMHECDPDMQVLRRSLHARITRLDCQRTARCVNR